MMSGGLYRQSSAGGRRVGTWTPVWVFIILALSVLTTGCGEEFDPAWRVQGYRLLGIQAEPPTLQSGGRATLRAVDYVPDGVEPTYRWEWCPFETSAENRYRCPEFDFEELSGSDGAALRVAVQALDAGTDAGDVGTGDVSMDAGGTVDASQSDAGGTGGSDAGGGPFPPSGEDPFELGTGESVQFPYPGTEQQILAVCQAIQRAVARAGEGSPLSGRLPTTDCTRGYEIPIRLVVELEDREVVASKKIELSTGSDQINKNPRVQGLEIRPEKASDIPSLRDRLDWVVSADEPRGEQWVELPSGRRLELVAGVPFDLRATVDRDDIEMWRPPAPEGADEPEPMELEIWQFNWFTTIGDLKESDRLYDPDLNTLETATSSGLTVNRDQLDDCSSSEGSCRGRLWQIVRDGRLGLDWVEREFEILTTNQ